MPFTTNDDVNILQASDSTNIGAGQGNDKYILSSSLSATAPGKTINITDPDGANTLQLISGLTIASSVVSATSLQLTLSNGVIVNVFGASSFSYEIGGDPLTGASGTIQNYSTFVTSTLGVPGVPTGSNTFTGGGKVIPGGSTPVTVGQIHTLTESITAGTPDVTAIYWGYNPHDATAGNSGTPADGGIPVADLVNFLTTITGLNFKQLGLIDADGVDPFRNVTSLTLNNPLSTGATNTTGGSGDNADASNTLTIYYADGTSMNAEAVLGTAYFDFLSSLLFDKNGNTRLFEKVITEGSSGGTQPIKLTPTVNNGGTIEPGVTGSGDDLIVAGRLDLLHQAYLDGGAGHNILEIDAKGLYAQPLQLLNIQEVRVNDLPNFYTTGSVSVQGGAGTDIYPDLVNGLHPGNNDSWLDLSRATAITKLVVTDESPDSGALTIVGIRNAATARLEGNFGGGTTILQYGQGQTGTLNVELALGDVTSDINLLQNAAVLNIDSQGVENHMHVFFAGGSVSRMNVKGTGVFGVDENLASSFNQGRPVIIDASANTGGLDVTLDNAGSGTQYTHYNVKVTGTVADDEIAVKNIHTTANNGKVVITANDGDNTIVTDGSDIVNISSGIGNDTISANEGVNVTIDTGAGDDIISANLSLNVTINAGAGNNRITANGGVSGATFGTTQVSITTGDGNDVISAVRANMVTIDAGAGNNTITTSAKEVNVTTGAGNDKLYLSGMDTTFDNGDLTEGGSGTGSDGFNGGNLDHYGLTSDFVDALAPGALLNLSLGEGSNTIYLGRDVTDLDASPDVDAQYGITALEGSVITGTGIKLFVENNSDLTEANLTNATITSVVLKQELRITDDQFTAIGSTAFSVLRDEEGATEDLYLVVNSSTSMDQILNGHALSTNVRLHFELHDGAVLTLSAEQLSKNVAVNGINGADGLNGKVVITDAGLNFDPFNSGPAYLVIEGGTISGGSLGATDDITILRSVNGYERPTPSSSTDTLTINSDVTPLVNTAIISEVATLKIIGAADITFSHPVDLGRDAIDGTHPAMADGRAPDWAAPETDAYTIDFSALVGKMLGLTVANFQDVKQIKGNGTAVAPVTVNVELTDGSTVGASGQANGLKTSGVQTYVVTAIGDDSVGEDVHASSATIYLCDQSKDVKVVGLLGNWNDTLNVKQINWGINLLLEGGGTAKADGDPNYSNVGTLNAEYFFTGATANVEIKHQDAADTRPLHVAGLNIANAKTINVSVDEGNAIIDSINNDDASIGFVFGKDVVENLVLTSAGDVTVKGNLDIGDNAAGHLKTLDASAVAGIFTLNLTTTLLTDLSNTTVTGLDKVVFGADHAALTLSVDQAITIGPTNVTTATGIVDSTLNFENLADQAIDMTAFGVKNIGTVSIADVNGTVTLDHGTVLGNALNNADSLLIKADQNDTTVEMTAAQFSQLNGNGTVTSSNGTDSSTGKDFKATMVLTDLTPSAQINLSDVDQSIATTTHSKVDVVLRVEGLTATNDFGIAGDADTSVTLEVAAGASDLSKGGLGSFVKAVHFTGDATLTLTAAQVAAIGTTDADGDGDADAWTVAPGVTVKLNVTDVHDGFALDLNKLEAAGIDIGALTLADTNASITFAAAATLGNADSIVTPTDAVDGIEDTTLSLNASQFNQLAGTGTITGGATVNITDLLNNTDTDHLVPLTPDTAVIDVSGISAPKGTMTLGQATVTLDGSSNVSGFNIALGHGQMIQFSTAAQASGQMVTEVTFGPTTTAIAWLFTSLGALSAVDTSKYDGHINTLYILEDLVDGKNEESLWTTLAESIVVEKTNVNGIPDVLIAFDRVNTFEALTAIAGVTYDDQEQFATIQDLTINLEGNTSIGNVGIGDTVGEGDFQSLTINSYEDRSTLTSDNGFNFQPNKVGNIGLNAGTTDELLNVTLNTYRNADGVLVLGDHLGAPTSDGGFYDDDNVSSAAAERDGLALEVGTITFGANATVAHPTSTAHLTLTGDEDITIAAVNIADAEVNLLDIDATSLTGNLVINAISPVNGFNDFEHIYVMDGFTGGVTDVLGTGPNDDLLVVDGGNNDLTKIPLANFDIDAVHFNKNGTLTLTAEQVAAIGTTDGPDADHIADAWSALAGLNVTLNITELDGASASMALDLVAAAGINIGTITIKDTNATVSMNPTTNLGSADSIIVPAGTTLDLTAAQFDQLDGTGTITGLTATGEAKGKVNITTLVNTLDDADLDTIPDDYTEIDVTGITADHGTITLGAADVTVGVLSKLGQFSITLDDINSSGVPNELAGQTIRFSTAAQAERAIMVQGADPAVGMVAGDPERDTNVVWLFNTITGTATAGKINTHEYDAALGRVWVNDQLVNGHNVEDIFSSPSAILTNPTTGLVNLNSTTIIRVVNTADLATLLPENHGVDRTVEVESFTQLPAGLIFNNPDKLVGVENLTLDLGGAVNIGTLSIDDIVAPSIINNNQFGTLTINSKLAGPAMDTYLLPEGFDPAHNPYPSTANVIGAISSGATRDEMANVTIHTFGAGQGVGLNTGTITFAETANLVSNPAPQNHTATLTVDGSKNVNIVSVNTADPDITALVVNTTGYTGVLTAPGTSPGFALNDTEALTFKNGDVVDDPLTTLVNEGGTITLGRVEAGAVTANAGVAGDKLSVIDALHYDGTLNLGILAQLDSTNDTADLNADGDMNDTVGGVAETRALTFTSGQGITTATLATANGLTPTLNAGSEWSFDFTGAASGSYLKITSSAVFQGGSTLRLNNVPLVIEGAVNLSQLVDNPATATYTEGLFITGGTIEVLAGATLTLTAAQVYALDVALVNIVGEGTIKVTGDASNLALGANLHTAVVDISGVTLIASPAAGFDVDDTVDLTLLTGATVGATPNLAQTVLGSPNADAITTTSPGKDTITGGAGNDSINAGAGNNTINVDAGTDTITGLNTGDVLVVSSTATANASLLTGFVATPATVNNGTVTLTNIGTDATSTINVLAATGSKGFDLHGSAAAALYADFLIGGNQADIINGGNDTQTNVLAIDTLTGNGGADSFVFDISKSNPTQPVIAPVVAAIDRELITVTADGTDNNDETISITYAVNGVASAIIVDNSPALDVTDANAVASAIATALDAVGGISASAVGAVVTIAGDNGNSIQLIGATATIGGTVTTLAAAYSDGTDVAQSTDVVIAPTIVTGELYSVLVTLAEGTTLGVSYTAVFGDTATDVANALTTAFNTLPAAVGVVLASNVGNVLTFNDLVDDDGGFTVTAAGAGAVTGSGASVLGAAVDASPTLAEATADVITDFATGVDHISFVDNNGVALAAGQATNYLEAATAPDFATALSNAQVAMDGVVIYYVTSSTADATGLVFFDANSDGNVDGVVSLTGITSANFAFSDIHA